MSAILTLTMARKAVDLTIPSLDAMAEQGVIKRPHRYIVVMSGSTNLKSTAHELWADPHVSIYEFPFGDRAEWTGDYGRIARSKAMLTHFHRMPTQIIQERCPYLLEEGDTTYFGSAYADGLTVACSGVEPWFDEMISWWVLSAIRALSIDAVKKNRVPIDENGFVK